ncbi:hypothetical protein ACIBHX_49900 [Nonomuraea sp. NPDC050536]|uniref:hypothetical protein n=1 Tax=Nonomuraea sp. NPDC050536 TaxID=3364366 RepID=UPI0037C65DF0
MLKRLIIGAALAASTFTLTGAVTTSPASASTTPSCSVPAKHTGHSMRKCKWMWDSHHHWCKWCWRHGHWEMQWCKMTHHGMTHHGM